MIELVGHALVDGTVNLNIYVIPDLVDPDVGQEIGVTLLPERTSEQIRVRALNPCPAGIFSVFLLARPVSLRERRKEMGARFLEVFGPNGSSILWN